MTSFCVTCTKKIDIRNNQKGVLIYERDNDNNRSSKNARNKSKHHQEMGGNGKGKKGKKDDELLNIRDKYGKIVRVITFP